MKKILRYFSLGEWILWLGSMTLIIVSFCLFDRVNYLTLAASIVGVTSLIFCAKGNPVGQVLILVFSVLYGVISYGFKYYGEMITYLGMTAPMAVVALVLWLKNPYNGNRSQVKVNRVGAKGWAIISALTVIITVAFYFILSAFGTANIIPSTVSVATSFFAVCLTFRRSPYFALAYAANDGVLIVMWSLAAAQDISYLSVIICFAVFFVNDVYGFINWRRMAALQKAVAEGEL